MSTKPLDRLLKDIPGDSQPAFVRRAYLRAIVDQVNRNTIALAPPRALQPVAAQSAIDDEIVEDLQEGADELVDSGVGIVSDIWKEVAKTYEEVDVDGVTIRRRTSSLFRSTKTGDLTAMFFDNEDLA